MCACSVSGSYQVAAVCGLRAPRAARDALDRLHRDVALAAQREQALDVGGVLLVTRDDVAVREEHGVEREALEAAAVHLGDREPVAGHADEADEPLVARLDRGA